LPASPTDLNKKKFSQKFHNHGGQLQRASQEYKIPLDDWLDLSTGINPNSYPLTDVPNTVWQRLPEINDGLEKAARQYYGSDYLLAVAGSQEAIQRLPSIISKHKKLKVGILKPAYHSHQQAWEQQGHELISLSREQVTPLQLASLDVLVVVNPTNPTTEFFKTDLLLKWHQSLNQHGGTLIVDEAFIDTTPELSLIQKSPKPGLIVLRSIGKFFGLAGIRLGFVWAHSDILQSLEMLQDDWSVSHPARWAGTHALQDNSWQQIQRKLLPQQSARLVKLLEEMIFTKPLINGGVYFNTTNQHVHTTALFAYFEHPRAQIIYQQLAQQGVLIRLFESPPALRFGLPTGEPQWKKLADALDAVRL